MPTCLEDLFCVRAHVRCEYTGYVCITPLLFALKRGAFQKYLRDLGAQVPLRVNVIYLINFFMRLVLLNLLHAFKMSPLSSLESIGIATLVLHMTFV